MTERNQTVIKNGVSMGVVAAMIISYVKWQSILWMLFHGLFSWLYVLYFAVVHQ